MHDVMFKFRPEMFQKGPYRHRGGIAQGADGAAHDVSGNLIELGQVLWAALAIFDPADHTPQPAGALAAGGALSA